MLKGACGEYTSESLTIELGNKTIEILIIQDIAALAMQKNCPVLSNDSDFFIFSVEFIPLYSVDISRTIEEGQLVAMRFNREKLLRHYGFKSEGKL